MQINLVNYLMRQDSLLRTSNPIVLRNPLLTIVQKTKQVQLFGVVVLLHILLIYALLNGLFKQVAHTVPAEVFATLILAQSPTPQPQPSPSIQALPKTTAIGKPVAVQVAESPASETPNVENVAVPAPATVPSADSAAAASVAPVAIQPKTISSGVEYIRAPLADYPLPSRRMREQGKTLIRVLVNEQGLPAQAAIQQSSGSARLDDAAKVAVLGALFKPFNENGKAITVYALVPIRFQLDS